MRTRSNAAVQSSRDKWLWPLLSLLAIGQIVALWLLCQNQVVQAQSRHEAFRAEAAALSGQFMNAEAAASTDSGAAYSLLLGDAGVRHRVVSQAD